MTIVDTEVAVMTALAGSAHALSLLSVGTAPVDGNTHKFISTRSAFDNIPSSQETHVAILHSSDCNI